jgi:hypothetical protein
MPEDLRRLAEYMRRRDEDGEWWSRGNPGQDLAEDVPPAEDAAP